MSHNKPTVDDLVTEALRSEIGLVCLRATVRVAERASRDTRDPEFAQTLRDKAECIRTKYKERSGQEL